MRRTVSSMKFIWLVLSVFVLLGGFSPLLAAGSKGVQQAAADALEGGYVIGAGDVLHVSVWKDEALTRTVTVLPDGMISFPLIGEIKMAGKKIAQIKAELEGLLTRYVPDVVLSVEVKQANSMQVYVIGHVRNPGRFGLSGHVDVLQALAMAGGLDAYANKKKIKIFRKQGNRTVIYPFRYDDVIDGSHLEANLQLKRGDVIVVP